MSQCRQGPSSQPQRSFFDLPLWYSWIGGRQCYLSQRTQLNPDWVRGWHNISNPCIHLRSLTGFCWARLEFMLMETNIFDWRSSKQKQKSHSAPYLGRNLHLKECADNKRKRVCEFMGKSLLSSLQQLVRDACIWCRTGGSYFSISTTNISHDKWHVKFPSCAGIFGPNII